MIDSNTQSVMHGVDPKLIETVPDDFVEQWCQNNTIVIGFVMLPLCLSFITIFVLGFILVVFSSAPIFGVGLAILIVVTIASYVGIFTGTVRNKLRRMKKSCLPIVELYDGTITYNWGHESLNAKLSDCRVRLGDAIRVKMCRRKGGQLTLFPGWRVILIDLPPFQRDLLGREYCYHTAAVGFTEEARAKWSKELAEHGCFPDSSADADRR